MLTSTPEPPYYAVIFSSIDNADLSGYQAKAKEMLELASKRPGFLGFESAKDKIGISVSYWKSSEDIANWKNNLYHLSAQSSGKNKWYKAFNVRIAKVERAYSFSKD